MDNILHKPKINYVETVARSRLFTIESVNLEFSNGVCRVYERMQPSDRESVMIVPVIDDHLLLIREYGVGIEDYELSFPKGLIDAGEEIMEAANRELMEEAGYGAQNFTFLHSLTIAPSYLSSKMNIVVAQKLYPQKRQGDEPETLPLVRWPVSHMLALLNEIDFCEARNISALFLAHAWLR
ncbi:ADP compounds hydrolase NudE [Candidatus Palibaumannia cicadellinicola]|uniref:ADP compounds hydrolase NudE n=1 Tax=Candidatus Palibaumannia cicadellinicola TaxID=186490 RepID=A0A088MXA0_9GAMM|nr:ADP compounds hydrolase NudE [Candidatus Baumannia cicadellinicola]AIN46902.1 ADP compounds hydrolase NudE [Candidatus Baumannia cicadellinicola]